MFTNITNENESRFISIDEKFEIIERRIERLENKIEKDFFYLSKKQDSILNILAAVIMIAGFLGIYLKL